MNTLARHIEQRLSTRSYCSVFEEQLAQAFPARKKDAAREAAIRAFAQERGWSVTIRDPGLRCVFKKLAA